MPIKIEHLNYTYDIGLPSEREALLDINLEFKDNCFSALIGRTGSGKSTLIQELNGLLKPNSGKIDVNGYVIDMSLEYTTKKGVTIVDQKKMKKKLKKKLSDIKSLRKRVGLVFQFPEYQIFEETVLKDVSYGPRNFGATSEEAANDAKEALRLVGIDETYYDRSPFELSGGEKRRVAIAGIIAMKPDILVLDEPTVGLDRAGEDNLMALLTNISKSGTSIVLSTHDMDVVLKYCDRAIVLEKGKIVSDSTPLELFRDMSFIKESSLEPPKVFSFAMKLKENGLDIDLAKVRDSASLADEIIRIKGVRK
ncbi:MAG: energy-coupling factor transporter ATPase [Bacilli bacterium]